MILSVTTLKDSKANVEKWVRRNLGCGIDHMIVFVDGPQPEVEALLDAHPHVSHVRADAEWYADAPAAMLNDRQIVNAGLTTRLLAGMDWAEWVFHIDGDEVALVERPDLDALEHGTTAVRLRTLEAVGQVHPERDPTLFKRRLSAGELHLLTELGALSEPVNSAYFRGQSSGKPGLRPSLDRGIGVHHVIDREANRVPLTQVPGLRVLHYESPSGEEFVRKWMALLSSGGHLDQRGHRASVAGSIRALLRLELGEEATRDFLYRLYEQQASDDVELLQRLGLLVEVDPDARQRTVESSPEAIRALRTLLERARGVAKRGFRVKEVSSDVDGRVAELQRGL